MRKRVLISILFIMLLIAFGGTVSHAAISKPKNFRIVYVSKKAKNWNSLNGRSMRCSRSFWTS